MNSQNDIFDLEVTTSVVIPFYCKRPSRMIPLSSAPGIESPLISVLPSEWDVVEIDTLTHEIFIWSPCYPDSAWPSIYKKVVKILRHDYDLRSAHSGSDRPSFDDVWKPLTGDRNKVGVSRNTTTDLRSTLIPMRRTKTPGRASQTGKTPDFGPSITSSFFSTSSSLCRGPGIGVHTLENNEDFSP